MNFFAWQDAARKRTRLLIALMALAILALTLGVNLLVGIISLATTSIGLGQLAAQPSLLLDTLTWEFFGGSLLFILLLVGGGSYYRIHSLSGGGQQIAEAMGGRWVDPERAQGLQRRLLNVVEEMAIASGTPVPEVYLLEAESGINAFAAGSTLDNAVIGVTQGCLEQLSRDELEGVIAHEFSHIVHGDMRLNLRLIGIVFGITMLTEIGQILLRAGGGRRHRYRSSRRDSNGAPVAFIGAGLLLLGFAGTFFGNWIRASVSRTREFLADASAVQYSRSPEGLANALKRIGGCYQGTELSTPHASEASHMLFASGIKGWFNGVFATHPPITERIEKLEPGWDGDFLAPLPDQSTQAAASAHQTAQANTNTGAAAAVSSLSGWNDPGSSGPTAALKVDGDNLQQSIRQMGQPKTEHFAYARALLNQLPDDVHRACRKPQQAHLVLLALMVAPQPQLRQQQRELLAPHYSDLESAQVFQLADQLASAELPDPLALLEIALPTLRHLQLKQRESLNLSLEALARADQSVNLFEWALIATVRHQLDSLGTNVMVMRDQFLRPQAITAELQLILTCFCRISKMAKEQQQRCYEDALQKMGLAPAPMPQRQLFNQLYRALGKARQLYPMDKEALLEVCCDCIRFDGHIALAEAQTLRAVAIMLDCPIPPLVTVPGAA